MSNRQPETCQCEGCQNPLARAFDFGYITKELEEPFEEPPWTYPQIVLGQNWAIFLSAVNKAWDIPNLTEAQRIKLFNRHYKPLRIKPLEGQAPCAERHAQRGGYDI